MFAIKGRLKVTLFATLAILLIFAGGTLFLTVEVFAGGDFSPHGINSHVHTNDTSNSGVEWIVKIGKLEWHDVSTFCWHYVFAKNTTGKSVTGDWEWKHHVKNKKGTWSKTDKILGDVNFRSNRQGSQQLTKSGWTSVDLPRPNTYRIEAYTRVDMVKDRRNITGNAGKRSIQAEWFDVKR